MRKYFALMIVALAVALSGCSSIGRVKIGLTIAPPGIILEVETKSATEAEQPMTEEAAEALERRLAELERAAAVPAEEEETPE